MNMNENKPNFLDRGTILALLLILVFWFGWSKFMEWKYPAPPKAPVEEQAKDLNVNKEAEVAETSETPDLETEPSAAVVSGDEKLLTHEEENFSFQISSRGMGLRNIVLHGYKTRDEQPIHLGDVTSNLPFSTYLPGSDTPLNFEIEKVAPDTYVGKATANGTRFEKTMKVDAPNYAIHVSIRVTGNMARFKGFSTALSEPIVPVKSSGFLGEFQQGQDWFIRHGGEKSRHAIKEDGLKVSNSNVEIVALSSHYFTISVVDRSDLKPQFESNIAPNAKIASGRLTYLPLTKPEVFEVKYVAYAGPKEFDVLSQVDSYLPDVIDFGVFGFLGKPILQLLKYLHSLVGNWGWAIVLLTIIVRLIVLPFNVYSYKSMKAMQKIQPEMNRIREKYKDKPADMRMQMNQEIMQLMKDNKASPLGGCLPMLLQLPPFFALYQVLGQSIELYRAPFIFWIQDLSAKDPFFVLPILMGVTMFIQQKITPTTMDPQQARIMMWMPVIFSFFMLSLPSGLTLYIFVSTLFGIGQQYLFMRDKSTIEGRVKEAKA